MWSILGRHLWRSDVRKNVVWPEVAPSLQMPAVSRPGMRMHNLPVINRFLAERLEDFAGRTAHRATPYEVTFTSTSVVLIYSE